MPCLCSTRQIGLGKARLFISKCSHLWLVRSAGISGSKHILRFAIWDSQLKRSRIQLGHDIFDVLGRRLMYIVLPHR